MAVEKNQNNWGSIFAPIASGAVNNAFGAFLAEQDRARNYRYQEMAANNADRRFRQQYKDMFSWSAQMQELEKAGLSPSIIMGGTPGQGGSTGAQGMGAGGLQTGFQPIDPMMAAQIANVKAETEKTEAETQEIKGETKPSKATMTLQLAEAAKLSEEQGFLRVSSEFKEAQTTWQLIENAWKDNKENISLQRMTLGLNEIIAQTRLINAQADREGLNLKFDLETFDTRKDTLKAELTETLNNASLLLARKNEAIKNLEVMDFNMEIAAEEILQGWRNLEIQDAGQKAQQRFYEAQARQWLREINLQERRFETEKEWKATEFKLEKREQNLKFASSLIQAYVSSCNATLNFLGNLAGIVKPKPARVAGFH